MTEPVIEYDGSIERDISPSAQSAPPTPLRLASQIDQWPVKEPYCEPMHDLHPYTLPPPDATGDGNGSETSKLSRASSVRSIPPDVVYDGSIEMELPPTCPHSPLLTEWPPTGGALGIPITGGALGAPLVSGGALGEPIGAPPPPPTAEHDLVAEAPEPLEYAETVVIPLYKESSAEASPIVRAVSGSARARHGFPAATSLAKGKGSASSAVCAAGVAAAALAVRGHMRYKY